MSSFSQSATSVARVTTVFSVASPTVHPVVRKIDESRPCSHTSRQTIRTRRMERKGRDKVLLLLSLPPSYNIAVVGRAPETRDQRSLRYGNNRFGNRADNFRSNFSYSSLFCISDQSKNKVLLTQIWENREEKDDLRKQGEANEAITYSGVPRVLFRNVIVSQEKHRILTRQSVMNHILLL